MFRFLRRVFGGFLGYFDLVSRMEEIEHETERLRDRVAEYELAWVDQVDKLSTLHKRAVKRIQDGTAALAEATPSVMDVRAQRTLRKSQLRQGGVSGSSGTP